jgi:putative endonuclease
MGLTLRGVFMQYRETENPSMTNGGHVYIMTNKPFGKLYIGVTANLAERVFAHKDGRGSAFCLRYNLTRLVQAEPFDDIADAIAREKAMKRWYRAWKLRLISEQNPNWNDLFETLA